MRIRHTPAAIVTTILLFSTACESEPTGNDEPAVIQSVAIDSSAGPLIRTATITLDRPAPIAVQYTAPGLPGLQIEIEEESGIHNVVLPRLRASREYTLLVRTSEPGSSTTTVTFGTGALPPEIAALTFTETGTPTHPVALVEIVTASSGFLGLLMVEDGEIVGYQRSNGSLFGTASRENGNIVLLDNALGLVEYRLDGTIANRLPQPDSAPGAPYGRIHHEVITTSQNTLLFMANEIRNVDGEDVVGEAIWEWGPETGSVQKRWSAFDHMDWTTERGARSDVSNWLHGNGLAFGPNGNVVASFRNLDQIVSIAPGFNAVQWRLGGAGATLGLAPEDLFFGQHGPSMPGPNRVLVYDNGFDRPGGEFSRVIEYEIDIAADTATKVWEFRADPDVYTPVVGSAYRLGNGNTVLLFGMVAGGLGATGPLVALEVTTDGTEQWRLAAGPEVTRLYRVRPVPALLGEVRIGVSSG